MILNYKQFKLINFPVYGLRSDDVEVTSGLLRSGHLVIDDRNQIGDSLGKRRLQTPHQLYTLKFCYIDKTDLVRAKHKTFVDSKGYVFIYAKTEYTNVVYHKILKVVPKDIITVLKLSNVSFPVVVNRPPPLGKSWVGMLYLNNRPWIPYEYSEERCTTMKRKI